MSNASKNNDYIIRCNNFKPSSDKAEFTYLVATGLELTTFTLRKVAGDLKTAPGTISRWSNGLTAPAPFMQPRVISYFAKQVNSINTMPSKEAVEESRDALEEIRLTYFIQNSGYGDEWLESCQHVDDLEVLEKRLSEAKDALKALKAKKVLSKEEILELCKSKPRQT